MHTIHDPRYARVIQRLTKARRDCGTSQAELASKLGWNHRTVSRVETLERRLDICEMMDWATACDLDPADLLQAITNADHRQTR